MEKEKITGIIYTDDISELVRNLNKNKSKFHKVSFNRRGDYWEIEIENEDLDDDNKIFTEIEKFINNLPNIEGKESKIKREKDGVVTDEVIQE